MNSQLSLKDRNILITGDSSHFTASLASRLAEQGASVLIADNETKGLQSFAESFSEQREIYSHYGRLALVDFDKQNPQDQAMVFQTASESFGGVSCWIDLDPLISNIAIDSHEFTEQSKSFFDTQVMPLLGMYKQAHAFLNEKRNACILRFCPEKTYRQNDNEFNLFYAAGFEALHSSINRQKKTKVRFLNLEVGPTEIYLLSAYPGMKINEALTKYQEHKPEAELVDVDELATSIGFLVGDSRSNLKISNLSLLSQ